MIDIHTHLLPGVDDGSPSLEHSAKVLARLLSEGVRGLVCTPHLDASAAGAAPFEEHADLLESLREVSPPDLVLYPGFEIMLDRPGMDLTDGRLGLAHSHARLVEFPRRHLPANATEELLRIRSDGLVPVVAHPERYLGADTRMISEWRELGAVIQVDSMALLGTGPMTLAARAMLEAGQVDILASDNHGDRRSLAIARAWLSEIGGADATVIMTETNPGLLLAGKALLPVPPVRLHPGVLQRVREWLGRGSRRRAEGDDRGANERQG